MATRTNDTTSTISEPEATSPLTRLGLRPGQVVQELGYDDDVDQEMRDEVEQITGAELVDGDYGDVVDACLLWFRADDDDLTDAVIDSLTDLDDQAFVLVLTPKAGRPGHVAASEVAEAATTAGLHVSGSVACTSWVGTRLVPPKNTRQSTRR